MYVTLKQSEIIAFDAFLLGFGYGQSPGRSVVGPVYYRGRPMGW